jgi:hypothetical protein
MPGDEPPSEALRVAAESFDPSAFEKYVDLYETQRAELLERFPAGWLSSSLPRCRSGTGQGSDSRVSAS